MSAHRLACVHHFYHVVTNSDGKPTCRGCGLAPTEAEKEAGIESLVRWEEARNRATLRPSRNNR